MSLLTWSEALSKTALPTPFQNPMARAGYMDGWLGGEGIARRFVLEGLRLGRERPEETIRRT
jgi:hypothetical protein